MRRGNIVPLHEFLSETFAALELRGGSRWPEDAESALLEFVNDAEVERDLRADDSQVDAELLCERDQRRDVLYIAGETFGLIGDAAVAGGAVEVRDAGRLPQLPRYCVFAPAPADDQHFHGILSIKEALSGYPRKFAVNWSAIAQG